MKISFALHVIGLVMWPGALMILTRFMKLLCNPGGAAASEIAALSKRVFSGFVLPGLFLSLVSGIYQIFHTSVEGFGYYKTQGWFHTKLTLVVLLIVLTFVILSQIKKAAAGQTLSRGKVTFLHAAVSSILVVVVFLTFLGR